VRPRGVGANSALALAGDAASKASGLVVVVVAARFFTVSEFAALATGLALAGVLTALLDLGVGLLVSRDGAKCRTARGALLSGSLLARLPIFCVVLLGAPFVGAFLGRMLTAVAVATLGVAGALALSVLGLYRSCRDIRPEALQKLAAGTIAVAAAVGSALVAPRSDALLLALAGITLATLVPLALRLTTVADFTGELQPLATLRRAAPIGLLALATIAYYRSGTVALAALSDARATAAFGVAASLAFGLLMLPNAITTALLPRLAVEPDLDALVRCTRRALVWTSLLAVGVAGASALVVPVVLPVALGPEYGNAGAPFAILCIGIPLIAASGIIGTALLTLGRLRVLGAQVAVSFAINIAVLVLLVPDVGAIGAAVATVACEAVGLAILVHAAQSTLPGLLLPAPFAARPAIDGPETAMP
jgi:O-antigen/teichoic acid export membrane protein